MQFIKKKMTQYVVLKHQKIINEYNEQAQIEKIQREERKEKEAKKQDIKNN